MVKQSVMPFFLFFLFLSNLLADDSTAQEFLMQRVRSFMSKERFEKDRVFVDKLFAASSDFLDANSTVDSMKVIGTLKANGLLELFFKKPQEMQVEFHMSDSAMFFAKTLSDSMRQLGYYRYATRESKLEKGVFRWTISLTSEYAPDPLLLARELAKNSVSIKDVNKASDTHWIYSIDMTNAMLDVLVLRKDESSRVKKSLHPIWVNVEHISKFRIISTSKNSWFPQLLLFDDKLQLVDSISYDVHKKEVVVDVPKRAKYMKISDVYTMKNIKDELILNPF